MKRLLPCEGSSQEGVLALTFIHDPFTSAAGFTLLTGPFLIQPNHITNLKTNCLDGEIIWLHNVSMRLLTQEHHKLTSYQPNVLFLAFKKLQYEHVGPLNRCNITWKYHLNTNTGVLNPFQAKAPSFQQLSASAPFCTNPFKSPLTILKKNSMQR